MTKTHYEQELEQILDSVINNLVKESREINDELVKWRRQANSLEKLAAEAELKVKKRYLKKLIVATLGSVKASTHRIILVSIATDN
jgi:hypothetical protein